MRNKRLIAALTLVCIFGSFVEAVKIPWRIMGGLVSASAFCGAKSSQVLHAEGPEGNNKSKNIYRSLSSELKFKNSFDPICQTNSSKSSIAKFKYISGDCAKHFSIKFSRMYNITELSNGKLVAAVRMPNYNSRMATFDCERGWIIDDTEYDFVEQILSLPNGKAIALIDLVDKPFNTAIYEFNGKDWSESTHGHYPSSQRKLKLLDDGTVIVVFSLDSSCFSRQSLMFYRNGVWTFDKRDFKYIYDIDQTEDGGLVVGYKKDDYKCSFAYFKNGVWQDDEDDEIGLGYFAALSDGGLLTGVKDETYNDYITLAVWRNNSLQKDTTIYKGIYSVAALEGGGAIIRVIYDDCGINAFTTLYFDGEKYIDMGNVDYTVLGDKRKVVLYKNNHLKQSSLSLLSNGTAENLECSFENNEHIQSVVALASGNVLIHTNLRIFEMSL